MDSFNAIRAQNRFAKDHKPEKRTWNKANGRANTVAAFVLFEWVVTVAIALLAVKLAGSSKKSDKEEPLVVEAPEEKATAEEKA